MFDVNSFIKKKIILETINLQVGKGDQILKLYMISKQNHRRERLIVSQIFGISTKNALFRKRNSYE